MSTPTGIEPRLGRFRRGFTLIEVIGATAAFIIAFLAGSAAFARLLQQQTTTYHRTLSAAAAMLLTDWHVDKNSPGGGDFLTSTSDILDEPASVSNVTFRGDDYAAGDEVRVFKTTGVTDVGDDALKTYGSLVITVSAPSATETAGSIQMQWRQVTFWQGSTEGVRSNRPTTVHFLARYLVPDQHL